MTTYTYTTHHSTAIASLLLALCYASAFAHSHAHSHEGCVCVCVGFFAHRIMRFPSMGRRVLQSIFARYTCASICTCNWPSFARRHCSPATSRRFVLCVQTNWLRSHSVSSARSQQNNTPPITHPTRCVYTYNNTESWQCANATTHSERPRAFWGADVCRRSRCKRNKTLCSHKCSVWMRCNYRCDR